MLRIHFTADDLARVRMAARPDVLWETILSFHRLRDRRGATVFGEWRSETRARLNGETRLLAALVPPRGYFPDFLTPPEARHGLDAGLEALRATAPGRLHTELALVAARRGSVPVLPGRLAALAEGRSEPLARLIGVLRSYYRAAVEPYWPHLQARVEADRAVRGRALLDGGADELLASLPPVLRWRPPVLEADYPVERELHLNGRGLLLQPSFFCRGTPVVYRNSALPPVLVYPVAHACEPAFGEACGTSLGKLVGHTRSAVLQAIRNGGTTSELARRAGVSLASASQHAAVLREAGLVVTLRHGNAVLHTLTPLGAALLRGGAAPEAAGYARNGPVTS
ncbi:winged helix-turn-helix domain-containing protein [Streptomyces sp. NBC_01142]|uniref:ArsR/SmtB family transcription factor n=1 Tax=Streptomyces sp. NBC_01142 TaxID=2975865 RepID=UPI00224C9591|nr:winged helix-turn-helix domain-containing protein [Streptomyces sp. NBC_01142]MCX4822935.1 winged helix-turn-helix domain-containing protein [Streptomyces sp. NBC_01142]